MTAPIPRCQPDSDEPFKPWVRPKREVYTGPIIPDPVECSMDEIFEMFPEDEA